MNQSPSEARTAFAAARVARLATSDADGRPHLVPVTFAVGAAGASGVYAVYTPIDAKPKKPGPRVLRRVRNIEQNPTVCLLADEYCEDWQQLWWARADGRARLIAKGEQGFADAERALKAKYPQYADVAIEGMIVVDVESWTGWRYSAA